MDERLKAFFDVSKYLLVNAVDVGDCLLEFQKTQEHLTELIKLEMDLKRIYEEKNTEFITFLSDKRDSIYSVMMNAGVKPSERVLDDRVIRLNKVEYEKKKKEVDDAKIDFEAATSLKMAMFQRKDAICHTIEYIRTKKDSDSCIMRNKQLIHRLGVMLND